MAAKACVILLLTILTISSLSSKSSSQTPEKEKQILLEIKNSFGNPTSLQSWANNSALPHCNWIGIRCSGNGFVTAISLSNQNISEPIPAAICRLKNLSYVDLSYNNIPGGFPIALYNCFNLHYLDISQNYFVGTIPVDVDRMPAGLTYLGLSANNFSGDIPSALGRLPSLQSLLLDNNLFNGSVPAELGNISTLENLWLASNPFAPATIPRAFGDLTKLIFLWMSNNNLIGKIPDSFSKLAELQQLDLSMNTLTGQIPVGIWMLPKLQKLYLYANKLSGTINGTVGAQDLTQIDISINNLSGPIPEDFGKLMGLQGLAMYYNSFSGEIPESIWLLPSLADIRLFNNKLTGVLPPRLGKQPNLWNIDISNNQISGKLPETLCASKSLKSLVVFSNNLSGKLPESLGSCPKLDNIMIQNNSFTGDVPAGIWLAVNLTTVIMNDNALTGVLPDKLPWNLSRLNIGNNKFSGAIPSQARNLKIFEAANNQFSGKIPADVSQISGVQTLTLGGNQISGEIPEEISSLTHLNVLDLSGNQLNGSIPASIGSLPVLTTLDLSSNELTGVIPPELGDLKLNFLNLSSNQLSGEVPVPLQNRAYDRSFLANPGVCSSSAILDLSVCGAKSNGRDHIAVAFILLIVFGGLGVLVLATMLIVMVRDYRRRMDGTDLAVWKLTSFQRFDFNEANILQGLTEENLIGSGGSGKVYRIVVGNRTGDVVAVKKIWNRKKTDSKLVKEFLAEVEILASIHHANIVKLICCISNPDSKLLVYEYMENGSLDRWLHDCRRAEGPPSPHRVYVALDWPMRMAIAIGAARGLCYMHHDCKPPVIHRDIKSSNILLDAEFGVKIADFGLARMLANAGEPEAVSAVAGSFGYMAPECAYSRKVSEKIDVYSFGVVLLELTTGREAHDGGDHGSLADWAWRHFQDGGNVMGAVDEEIRDPAYSEEMETVLRLGIICTGALPSSRPTMKEVLQVLLRCDKAAVAGDKTPKEFDVVPLMQTRKGRRSKRLSNANQADDSFDCNV